MQRCRSVGGSAVGGSLLAMLLGGCVAAPDLRGPLPTRNQHPAQLTVMHLDPASAAVRPAGRVAVRADFAYTSLFLDGSRGSRQWVMDGETLRAALDLRVGLGHGLQLGTQLAAAHTSGGFLDDFVIDYHELFGFPDQGRDTSPRDDYLIEATRGSTTLWEVEKSNVEWLDLPLHLTWQLAEPGPDRLGVAVRGGIELPTGDQNRGYGNGQVDASFGALLDWRVGGVGLFGHAQHTFTGTPDRTRNRGLTFRDVSSFGLGAELPLSRDLHALVQVEYETSTLRDLGPSVASRDQMLLWVGGRYQPTPQWGVEVGFGEDLIGLVSPDFTAWLAVSWTP